MSDTESYICSLAAAHWSVTRGISSLAQRTDMGLTFSKRSSRIHIIRRYFDKQRFAIGDSETCRHRCCLHRAVLPRHLGKELQVLDAMAQAHIVFDGEQELDHAWTLPTIIRQWNATSTPNDVALLVFLHELHDCEAHTPHT